MMIFTICRGEKRTEIAGTKGAEKIQGRKCNDERRRENRGTNTGTKRAEKIQERIKERKAQRK